MLLLSPAIQIRLVMPGLVPGIHVFLCVKAWMAGSSPAMTTKDLDAFYVVIPAEAGIQ
jgi:hypothetical protein